MLVLERRAERSVTAALVSPLIAVALTVVTMAIIFTLIGKNPFHALYVYFIEPLFDSYSLQEIVVKATPLVLIGVGLALCYVANVWNIGAEGQFLIGAVCGSWLAVKTHGTEAGIWVMPAMLVLGALGGALYAMIPALCRVKFGASEILTSLMLVYVADLLLDYLTRGPWRDPKGFNFPTTAAFDANATMPIMFEGSRLHYGAVLALIIVAFLGRLNPVGILIAGLFLALTFIGGEGAQITLKVPLDLTKVFQGILLFFVLACDSMITYRIRFIRAVQARAHGSTHGPA